MYAARSRPSSIALVLAMLFGAVSVPAQNAQAVSAGIVISQVYGGGGNSGATLKNDFIELYNRGSVPVDVTGWSVQYTSSTGASWQKTNISGVIQPGHYYLVQESAGAGGTVNLPAPDAIGAIFMSATAGKVALLSSNVLVTSGTSCPSVNVVDLIGFGSATNCSEVSPTPNLSNTTAALRKANGSVDNDNNNQDFRIASPSPRNSAAPDVGPYILDTTPANGATSVAATANVLVHYSELVSNASAGWITLECSLSGLHDGQTDISAVDEERIFDFDPYDDFAAGETCTVTVHGDQVFDLDPYDPPDFQDADTVFSFEVGNDCELAYTPIYNIQGSGAAAAITGTVTTQGVVVGDYEGPSPTLRGFYLQDATGDADAATSDGIFVFNGSNNAVAVGDVARVSGNAEEFQDQTQIGATSVVNCGEGSVAPVDVNLPFPDATYPERYEGMLVRLPQTLVVTEHFQLGRFGMVVMSSGDRLWQPTHLVEPGEPALAMQAANNLNRIIIDDALNNQNPDPIQFGRGGLTLSALNTLRGGDTATGIVGVMTYTWSGNAASGNAYRVRPVNALGGGVPNFQPDNARPTTPDDVGGTLKIVGMNVLNYFNTFDGSSANPPWACNLGVGGPLTDCRGPDNLAEFDRQWPKIVAAILAQNSDVIGVNEIENDGYGPGSALATLVDQLNAATAPGTYAFIDADAGTGQLNALGMDAIKVGLMYKPGSVTPVGQTAVLNSVEFVNGGDGAARSRPSLAQAFAQNANGQVFIVDVNHLKSKGSPCDAPDAGDGQGTCSGVRTASANALTAWLASDPTGTGDPDVLLIGDYNSYAREDPIDAILSAGFTNLLEELLGPSAYSYVFDGQWGNLDYAFASPEALGQVKGVTSYHIDADEPSVLDYNVNFKSPGQILSLFSPDQYRASDHDPIVVGLCQPPTLSVSVSEQELWPANHKYVTVDATTVASADAATVQLISVTSNEPDDGLGDGDETNDIVILDADSFDLRAERSGLGSGREYTITYEVTNTCGATALASAVVTVPHNR
ncbi:MAG TPA: ExeM/NucH family extracellular endonuclease [Anaerolineales bacterium]|nr:ExeM/NucH family extracellular endonuclease [Anaerolineales bacterium]